MKSTLLGAVVLALIASSSCGSDDSNGLPTDHAVTTFQVGSDQTFRAELSSEILVSTALRLLNGDEAPSIPIGTVVRGEPGVNSPWTWHLDPSTIEFAEAATEVCDGLPSAVEKGEVTSDQYCPWAAKVVDVQSLS